MVSAKFHRAAVNPGGGEKKKKEKKKEKKKRGNGGKKGRREGKEEGKRGGGPREKIFKKLARTEAKVSKLLKRSMSVVVNDPKDARGLSVRDQLFVKNVLKGMDRAEAMSLASKAIGTELTEASAKQLGAEAMAKPQVESAIVSALEEAGIDDRLVAEKIREGFDATAYTQTGLEHTDFKTRLLYIQTVLKVKGQMGADVSSQQQVLNYTSFKDEE